MMNKIIQELKLSREHELHQIGMTPRTGFKGTQEEHDKYHRGRAEEYQKAIKILSSKYVVRDWLVSETHPFDNYDDADEFYKERLELCKGGETDVELYAIVENVNNVD